MYFFELTELNKVLEWLKQRKSLILQRMETSDASGDETDTSKRRRHIPSKKTFEMDNLYVASELGRFFVTRPIDAANKQSHLFRLVCGEDLLVLTHEHHEGMRHFQGARSFEPDQRLRLEKPGWRVLAFHGNPLGNDELERQKGKIKKGPV